MKKNVLEILRKMVGKFSSLAFICEWGQIVVVPRDHIIPPAKWELAREKELKVEEEVLKGTFIFYCASEKIQFTSVHSIVTLGAEECENIPLLRHKLEFFSFPCKEGEIEIISSIGECFRHKYTRLIGDILMEVKSFDFSEEGLFISNSFLNNKSENEKCYTIALNCKRQFIVNYCGVNVVIDYDWWRTEGALITVPYLKWDSQMVIEKEVFPKNSWEFDTDEKIAAFNEAAEALVKEKMAALNDQIINAVKYSLERGRASKMVHARISQKEVEEYLYLHK